MPIDPPGLRWEPTAEPIALPEPAELPEAPGPTPGGGEWWPEEVWARPAVEWGPQWWGDDPAVHPGG